MKQYIGHLHELESDLISEEETIETFKVARPDKVLVELPDSIIQKIEKCLVFMVQNNIHKIEFLSSTIKDTEHAKFTYYKDDVELVSPYYEDFDRQWKVFKTDRANIVIDSFYQRSIRIELLYSNSYTEKMFVFSGINI